MRFHRDRLPALLPGLLLTILIAGAGVDGRAQSAPKYEVGAQFSLVRLRDLDTTDLGIGGRFTYNVNDQLGVEGEVNFFPQEEDRFFKGGRKTQGQFGVKYGIRSETAGAFAKLRPGFMRFSRLKILPCPPNQVCPAVLTLTEQTLFSLDVGGVLEFYPSRRVVTRFDLGDTMLRFKRDSHPFGEDFTSHNLQFSAGLGFRF